MFEAWTGLPLQLQSAAAVLQVRLLSVRRLPPHPLRQQPPFCATLEAVGTAHTWPQGVYRLCAPTGVEIDVFVVPVAANAEGSCYEIVFN